MPRAVDHEARRTQILEALVRLAARNGLHTVTMRSVATETGVSLRLVQYYFTSKARLMNAALRYLERRSHERWQARLDTLHDGHSVREYLDAFFAEALPTDAESRAFHLVWTSFAVLAMTDPHLAGQPFVEGPNRLEAGLAEILRRAQSVGTMAASRDADLEAARLVTINHGLGTSVLAGQRTPAQAMDAFGYHLDQLLGPAPNAAAVSRER